MKKFITNFLIFIVINAVLAASYLYLTQNWYHYNNENTYSSLLPMGKNQKYDLVIFDEINYVMKYNFLDPKEVVEELKRKPALKHVILTGNSAPLEIIELAHLVTEMKCIKHPFYEGIMAQPGIEY